MKRNILPILATAAIVLLGSAPPAEARHGHYRSHVYVSGYRSCGTPIYTERYFIRHDCWGRPVWGYRVVTPPRRYCPPPPCVPPPCAYPYRRSGVHFHGHFRY
jgi:hypothetical protein